MPGFNEILQSFGLSPANALRPCGQDPVPGAGYDTFTDELKGGLSRPNGRSAAEVGPDSWCGIQHNTGGATTDGLRILCISAIPLPPEHRFLYQPFLSGGDLGWNTPVVEQGTTTRPPELIEGVRMKIVGPEAARYRVSYAIKTTDGLEISASDWGEAGTEGRTLRVNAVKASIAVL
jgi:hypothetical protein